MKKLAFYTTLTLVLTVTEMYAQNGETSDNPQIVALGAVKGGNIVLRWAPDSPVAWELSNRYGYTVERYTILRDSSVVTRPEKTVLTTESRPWPMAAWESLADEDDFAAIAAQAIYGETFELTGDYASDVGQVYMKSKEMESRFSFALFSADHSYTVAEASGLTITDPTARKNERYLYRVYANVPTEKLAIDTAFVYIGLEDYVPLPKPSGISAQFADKAALISWDWANLQDFYNSFILERSDDGGKTFKPVTAAPIINSEPENEKIPEKMIYLDSLSQNNTEVFYRVKGISTFGEVSIPSDTVSGIPRPDLLAVPQVLRAQVDEQGVKIQWNFPPEIGILGFRLYRADSFKGDYQLIFDNISAEKREIRHSTPPSSSNYYSVSAFDKYGNETKSLPTFAAIEDSIPPLPPAGLTGFIDSVGVVTLSWDPNKEKDLEGYRVYKANFLNEEFGEVTKGAAKRATFRDTISVQTLTKAVYYKITAIDRHYNPSDFSEIIELKRPDLNPPIPPMFKSATSAMGGNHLEWICSPSKDVVSYTIYRKTGKSTYWEPIHIAEKFSTYNTFIDSLAVPGEFYEYTILAADDSGLESEPAKPVGLRSLDSGQRPSISNIFGKADREKKLIKMAWEYDVEGVEKFLVYRAIGSDKLSLHESLPAGQFQFEDDQLKVNTMYKYRIQAEFSNGALSPLSDELVVNY